MTHTPDGRNLDIGPRNTDAINSDYNVRATVSADEFDSVLREYRRRSDEATARLAGATVVYDERSGEQLDIWGTEPGLSRPVVLSIHGGYWRALGRHDAAFMAAVLADRGIATVTVDYSLAPTVTLEEIVRQVRAAVAWLYHHADEVGIDPSRITAVGSSAGGHLVGSLLVGGWQDALGLPDNALHAAMPISGLFDLAPLPYSFANEWLRFDDARARALSPMFAPPGAAAPSVIAVAERDGAGFLEQSRRFAEHRSEHAPTQLLEIPGRNHYDVFLDLADPSSVLFAALLGLLD